MITETYNTYFIQYLPRLNYATINFIVNTTTLHVPMFDPMFLSVLTYITTFNSYMLFLSIFEINISLKIEYLCQ